MVRTISKIAIAAVCLLALAVFTPQAKASADFQCPLTGCTGTVTLSGGVYSSLNVGVVSQNSFTLPGFGSDEGGESFTLSFSSTLGSTIKLTEDDATLTGTMIAFSSTGGATPRLDITVLWNVPKGFESLGDIHLELSATGCIDPIGITCYTVQSVDIPVNPAPEPASLLLLGTGLLGIGGAVRRRWSN